MTARGNSSPARRHRDAGSGPPSAAGGGETDDEVCRQVLRILALVGDKWSILVVGQLRDRTLRFSELHRAVRGISQRMLTLTLRQLERDGLLTRTVHPSVPPRVDYVLTPLGTTLLDSMTALADWAVTHRHEVDDNRRRYDAAHPPR
ncbi:helix-turn-helix domain-containing protein [Streptomyces sp. CSDS2]|uniref:winged helix-turn-helix transcriptional regulator n=1 Tax=Streptomyces sp. CSDS2 TaxID=3055051 RepID=UPI0025B0161B|nr:helix-turn-helix domain-containing protein [Streptomyces sp. CSDS2]MDN3263149.1 helix-turn-helix domain-containing protein [Streptomyces sp. CSDS2]